jgi:hypothetical protein
LVTFSLTLIRGGCFLFVFQSGELVDAPNTGSERAVMTLAHAEGSMLAH